MKINRLQWEKVRKQALLYLWPSLISGALMILVTPIIVKAAPVLSLAMPFLSLLVFVPFVWADVRRNNAGAAREKRELEAKYDAEDEKTFGQSLREMKL